MKRHPYRMVFAALLVLSGSCQQALAYDCGIALRPGKLLWVPSDFGKGGRGAEYPPGDDFVAVGVGKDMYIALRYDGSLIVWGADRHQGPVTNQPKGNNYIGIAGGMDHCTAMRSDGTILTWGWSEYGGNILTNSPKGTDFRAMSAGCASAVIRNDGPAPGQGSVFCWGDIAQKRVPTGNDWIAVKCGNKHFMALKADGSIAGWGGDTGGQTSSVQGTGCIAVSAGGYRNFAMKADGSVVIFTEQDNIKATESKGQGVVPTEKGFICMCAGYGSADIFMKPDHSLVFRHLQTGKPPTGNSFVGINSGYGHSLVILDPGKPWPSPTVHTFAVPGGDLVVHRAMDTGPDLKVNVTHNGSAGSVTIPKGACSVVVKGGGSLTLQPGDGYKVGTPNQATAAAGGTPMPASFWYRKIGPFAGPFAQEMKAARAKRALSQEEMAQMLGVQLETVKHWEAGWSTPIGWQDILKKATAGNGSSTATAVEISPTKEKAQPSAAGTDIQPTSSDAKPVMAANPLESASAGSDSATPSRSGPGSWLWFAAAAMAVFVLAGAGWAVHCWIQRKWPAVLLKRS